MAHKTKLVSAKYSPSSNTVRIKALSKDFYPQYLEYLFEYLKIPKNATIVFKDKTIEGGIKQWLKNL